MKSDKRVLIENTISMAITQLLTYAMPLISLPYLSRTLGVEKFGIVFWAQACMLYFFVLTDYGFSLSAVREIAVNRNDNKKISDIYNAVMVDKFLLLIISFLILTVLILFVPQFKKEGLLFYLTFFMVIGNVLYPIWYFQGIEHMKYVTFFKIISQSIFLMLIFIFIKSPNDYYYVALLNSFGYIISGLSGIFIAVKRYNLQIFIPKKEDVIQQFKYSTEFFIAKVSETFYTNTNSFLIGFVVSPVLVGYYIAAEKIMQAMQYLMLPIGSALYPYMAKTKNIKLYKKVFFISLIFISLVCIICCFIAPFLIEFFYGQDMLPAYKILRIFCITVMFSATSGLIGFPLVAAVGHTKIVNYSIIAASYIYIAVLILFLILKLLDIRTIACLTILPYAIMLSVRIACIIKFNLFKEK